jgi:hypothetical protein
MYFFIIVERNAYITSGKRHTFPKNNGPFLIEIGSVELCTKWRGTPYLTMVDWSGNGLSVTWEKAPDVDYDDVFNEFDSVWCVQGLIVTRRNLSVTRKVALRMGIIFMESPTFLRRCS